MPLLPKTGPVVVETLEVHGERMVTYTRPAKENKHVIQRK